MSRTIPQPVIERTQIMKTTPTYFAIAVLLSASAVLTGGIPVHAEDTVDSNLSAAITKLGTEQRAALQILVIGLVDASAEGASVNDLSATLAKLSPERKAALLVLVNGIVEASASQESPEEGAMKTVKAYVKAAEDADVEMLMTQISENFNHYEVGDKAGLKAFVDGVKTEGMLEDITGNTADAKTTLEGDVVTVYPIELEGIFGTVTYEFQLKKEVDAWKIVGFEMTGV
jgi:hypothetical protein